MPISLSGFEDVLAGVLANATITGINNGISIAWDWKTFVPTKGVPYLKPEMAGRSRRPMGVGANSVQEWDGVWQVSIFVPRDTGHHVIDKIASQVMALYPRGLTLQTSDGVWVYVTTSTPPPLQQYNDWIHLPLQIQWFATEPPPHVAP